MGFEQAGRLLHRTATYLFERARYPGAEPLFKRSLAIREKTLGPEHAQTAESLNDLAANYRKQGRYAEVESLYTNGPAGGGGATKSLREVIAVASAFVPREEVQTSVERMES